MYRSRRQQAGFTLIEVMIVVVIVAVLLSVALPGYQHQVRKTKRNIGKGQLMEVAARQEQYFVNNKQYADDLVDLGYSDPDGDDDFMIDSDGEIVADSDSSRIYLIRLQSINPARTEYLLEADPELAQDKDTQCGTLSLDHAGVKGEDGTLTVAECW